MKQILTLGLAMMLAFAASAQKDVTKFLGIPVDGTKSAMIQKLKAKGFETSDYKSDILVGEFNGTSVNIHIQTNNNKVCRIMVCDANTMDEGNIIVRFNKLCQQFSNNEKYLSLDEYTIPSDEDISYEMTVHHKQYDALFYQKPTDIDTMAFINEARSRLADKYTAEQFENPTEEVAEDLQKVAFSMAIEMMTKKAVWFRICEYYGEYYITLFYDNEYNRAQGEDL